MHASHGAPAPENEEIGLGSHGGRFRAGGLACLPAQRLDRRSPDQWFDIRSGIGAVMTKSVNDIATAIAEKIGGDEQAFARMSARRDECLGSTLLRK